MAENETAKKERKVLEGVVISNTMDKTVKVLVETKERHPVYKKVLNKGTVYFARSEKEVEEGDAVKIMEVRPLSKKVRWIVV